MPFDFYVKLDEEINAVLEFSNTNKLWAFFIMSAAAHVYAAPDMFVIKLWMNSEEILHLVLNACCQMKKPT